VTLQEINAFIPLIILAGGSVLSLLVGVFKPGGYLYEMAIALVVASLTWSLLLPTDGVLSGLSIDPFSRFFAVFLNTAGIVGLLLANGYNRRRGIVGEEFPATLLFALTGMNVACAATNLLILFLGLEAFTFAFYILAAIERGSWRGGEAGLKYLLNGTLSAAILAMGIALVYCSRGSLQLPELASQLAGQQESLFSLGMCMVLLGMAFKLSLVPAHLWTADVYQGAPAPVTALLSTASKGASVGALLLLMPLMPSWHVSHEIIWWLALLSMLFGNLAALVQTSIKRMLAWSSVAQMGYVAVAFVAAPSDGLRAAVFYAVVYAAAGLATFGAVAVLSGTTERDAIDEYRGRGYKNPLAGAVLALALFSLAGIPPAAGFMGKFSVFSAALRGGETVLAVVGVLTSLVSVFFYLRVVVTLYMKSADEPVQSEYPLLPAEVLALVIPTIVTLILGIFPAPLLDLLTLVL
jgi:NADH-quinone oxidoreductase subunit N